MIVLLLSLDKNNSEKYKYSVIISRFRPGFNGIIWQDNE
jgi:hypothetical protein